MKKLAFLTVALAILSFASPHFVQSNPADEPVPGKNAEFTETESPITVAMKILTGKVLSVNRAAKTLTVKKEGWLRAQEVMFSVDDAAVTHLADLKQDDWVDITYDEAEGKLIAKTIVRRVGKTGDT